MSTTPAPPGREPARASAYSLASLAALGIMDVLLAVALWANHTGRSPVLPLYGALIAVITAIVMVWLHDRRKG